MVRNDVSSLRGRGRPGTNEDIAELPRGESQPVLDMAASIDFADKCEHGCQTHPQIPTLLWFLFDPSSSHSPFFSLPGLPRADQASPLPFTAKSTSRAAPR